MEEPRAITENASFWNERWMQGATGWDIGYPSPAIAAYAQQFSNKDAAVLIPGCGNAYEAEALVAHGFSNITLVDIAPAAVERLRKRFANAPQVTVHCGDFFLHEGSYDLILEQTFFCALPLRRRNDYAEKTSSLLRSGGRLAGLLFNVEFPIEGPPFGGSAEEYKAVFQPYFSIKTMEPCYNSIPPRAGNELFMVLVKK